MKKQQLLSGIDIDLTIINAEQASKIMQDIFKGLERIHEKDYIHWDMKPENILISTSCDSAIDKNHRDYYTAKIADFGLSAEYRVNIYSNSTNVDEKMGTIIFMAPE